MAEAGLERGHRGLTAWETLQNRPGIPRSHSPVPSQAPQRQASMLHSVPGAPTRATQYTWL